MSAFAGADYGTALSSATAGPSGAAPSNGSATISATQQPASASGRYGGAPNFNLAAAGNSLSYQRQQGGASLVGATSPTFKTAELSPSHNSAVFQVAVSDTASGVRSNAATPRVISPLAERAWTAGTRLSTLASGEQVSRQVSGIDDAGNITSLLAQSVSGSGAMRLLAVRGTPGTTTSAPAWSTPARLDLAAPRALSESATIGVDVSPGGNAVAWWFSVEPCNVRPGGYNTVPGAACRWLYASRYLASSGNWEAPRLIGAVPAMGAVGRINDRGDVALMFFGWTVRPGSTGLDAGQDYRLAVARWVDGAADIPISLLEWRMLFVQTPGVDVQMGMDGSSRLTIAGHQSVAGSGAPQDIVAYRGTVSAGFGSAELLDTRTDPAGFQGLEVGRRSGEVVVAWGQNDGVNNPGQWVANLAANAAAGTNAWTVRALGLPRANSLALTVDDRGGARMYRFVECTWVGFDPATRAWGAETRIGSWSGMTCPYGPRSAFNRRGDVLAASGEAWATYDATTNTSVKAFDAAPRYIFGAFADTQVGLQPLLSMSGVGGLGFNRNYTTLPTAAAPQGERSAGSVAWGLFLR